MACELGAGYRARVDLAALLVVVVIGSSIWVAADASGREWENTNAFGWFLGCVLLWIVFFPVYLARRQRAPLKPRTAVRGRERRHPGWYDDPYGEASERYWDGKQWTHNTRGDTDPPDGGVTAEV